MRVLRGYLVSIALVALVTALGLPLRGYLADPDVVMLYLVAIAVAATLFGRGPAVLASAGSVLAWDFFFVVPFHTFAIADPHYLLTFAMMFAVGLITSGLVRRVRRGQIEALRSALLSTVSHDLRTPLAAITLAATALADEGGGLTAAQRAELLAAICEETNRLERLVANLLDMTRLESGALTIKREWVPLEEIVGAALGRVEALLDGRPIRTDLPATLPLVAVDPVLFEQVLINLLDNVAKHTPAGTSIELVARPSSNDKVTLEIADRGPGITAGDQARLFEKFFRGSRAAPNGAGLGLAICRGIMTAHGGTVTAANRPGGGAMFRVSIPSAGPTQAWAIPREMRGAS